MTHASRGGALWLLVNPRAGGGKGAARARAARDAFQAIAPVEVRETRGAGDECRIAREAVAAGARALLVLGGDGTVHHAVRGLALAGTPGEDIPLVVLAAGTADDLVKSLGAPSADYRAMASLLREEQVRRIDVGEIDGVPFVNSAGVGFDVEVLARLARTPGPTATAGTFTYVRAALTALTRYGGFSATFEPNGSAGVAAHRLMLVFANGGYFGGAFRIAPGARLDDGLLDVIDIGSLGTLARAGLFARALRGLHVGHAGVRASRGDSFVVRFDSPPAFEADGELCQATGTDLHVTVRRGALRVVAPAT